MKYLSLACLAVVTSFGLVSCHTQKPVVVAPSDSSISYMGRILWQDPAAPTFTYPGTTAAFNFKGSGVDMMAAPGSGQFMVTVDGGEPFKINFTPADSVLTLANALADGTHSMKVVYAIEGYEKHPEFHGFVLSGKAPKMLAPDARPELKMEFIGNSITCGYGAEETDPKVHFTYDSENHTLSYAYLTAQELNADFNVVARSGIGIYRYYGGDKEGTDKTMPLEYDNTLLYVPEYKWDHSSFVPDIICVNLGTNDTSLDNYDLDLLNSHYVDFVAHLRDLHPQAKIVLLTGSMLSGKRLDDVKGVLDGIAASDAEIYRFDMTPQTGSLGYGADYHPSIAQQRQMADELVGFLKANVLIK